MATAYIGLGSNIGDRLENCKQALRLMNTAQTQVLQVSSFYQTSPVGYTDQPDFINAAAKIQTRLEPLELLDFLQEIERSLGKNITVRWGPRSIDLDIVLYDNLIINQERLQIPHPRMLERSFVLIPLAEIAPEIIHPVAGKTIAELAKNVVT